MRIFKESAGEKIALPDEVRGTSLALGYFDGVHRGHQDVVNAAADMARENGLELAVFTFALGQKPGTGGMLQTEEQRAGALSALGVQFCFQPSFDSFRELEAECFFREVLVEKYRARALCCGDDFVFGKGRGGNVALLRILCKQYGLCLNVVSMEQYKGKDISSRRIRAALLAGEIEEVNAMLGRPYELALPVQHGQKLGSSLGFPTINQVFPPGMLSPGQGVYITQTVVEGKAWASVTGYGSRPTVAGQGETCETFIPGFAGDLYNQEVRVRFHKKIADIRRFETMEKLAAAVQEYARMAAEHFEE